MGLAPAVGRRRGLQGLTEAGARFGLRSGGAGCGGHGFGFLRLGLLRGRGGFLGLRRRVGRGGQALLEGPSRLGEGVGPAAALQVGLDPAQVRGVGGERATGVHGQVPQQAQAGPVRGAEHVPDVQPVVLVQAQAAVGHALELREPWAGVGRDASAGQFLKDAECADVALGHGGRDGLAAPLVGRDEADGGVVAEHPDVQFRSDGGRRGAVAHGQQQRAAGEG